MAERLVVGIYPDTDPKALESALGAQQLDLSKIKVVGGRVDDPDESKLEFVDVINDMDSNSLSDDMTRGTGIMGDAGGTSVPGIGRAAGHARFFFLAARRHARLLLRFFDSQRRGRQLRRRRRRRSSRRALSRCRCRRGKNRGRLQSGRPAQRSGLLAPAATRDEKLSSHRFVADATRVRSERSL